MANRSRARHPGLRFLIAVVVLAVVVPAIGSVLAAGVVLAFHHIPLLAALAALRLLLGLVPGLHDLLSALIGYRLTRFLIGAER